MKMKDITPAEFACATCSKCPSVFETESSYVIIGKKLSSAALAMVENRVGDDEFVVEVPKGMIDGLK
jgi:hypothetical protein